MVSVELLKETTNKFFADFCRDGILDYRAVWSSKWEFKGELPNNSEKGCYAHLNGNEVVYIGLAIGNSNEGSGLGSRISNYWKYDSIENGIKNYISTIDGIDSIITLPFTTDNFYLAAALEVYLIQNLKPIRNKIHSRRN